jgi:mRNA interferase MazF
MGALAKGEVVLYPFPFTDLSDRKLRPCLVLSEEMGEDILLCQITSKMQQDQYVVELKKDETRNGSLQIDSYIRTNMLFTAEKKQIVRRLCTVKRSIYNKVVRKVIAVIEK